MYRQWWVSENLPQWLPNTLQRYDRNNDLWQKWSNQFESLAASHEQGKQLPPPEALDLQNLTERRVDAKSPKGIPVPLKGDICAVNTPS